LIGCSAVVPCSELPAGLFEVEWEAKFGEQLSYVRAPQSLKLLPTGKSPRHLAIAASDAEALKING